MSELSLENRNSSLIFKELFADGGLEDMLSDRALIREMIGVESALAAAQARLGVIPEDSAKAIEEIARRIEIDPGQLSSSTGKDGVPVPALVELMCKALEDMGESRHADFLHFGATSQDIMDTALVLCVRKALKEIESRLSVVIELLAAAAGRHRRTLIAARTRNQAATVTVFGLRIISWLSPLIRHKQRLEQICPRLFVLSLSGASGNLATFQGRGLETGRIMAAMLGLAVPVSPWHSARDNIAELGCVLALVTGSLGKMCQDLLLSAQIGDGINAGAGGASSTMPHKQNPVLQEAVVALARNNAGFVSQLQESMIHAQERDGSAWNQELQILPLMLNATATALRHAVVLCRTIDVDKKKAERVFEDAQGLMMAEAASFALAEFIGLRNSRQVVRAACMKAIASEDHLKDVLASSPHRFDIDWDDVFDPVKATGEAEQMIDQFLDSIQALLNRSGPNAGKTE